MGCEPHKPPPPLLIVQARMSSRRLPGKVLRPLGGRPMIAWLIERLSHCRLAADVVVATSEDPSDDQLADWCRQEGVAVFRGPLDDVAERFRLAARTVGCDAFVRINGDSPLMDPALVDQAIALFRSGAWDVVSNVMWRSFPKGQSVEVVACQAFERLCTATADPQDREHVTRYFYNHLEEFRMVGFTSGGDFNRMQCSVDDQSDFDRAAQVLAAMTRPHWTYGWRDVAALAYEEEA